MAAYRLLNRSMRLSMLLAMAATWLLTPSPTRGDDWPQWQGPKRDSVYREQGLLDKFPDKGLEQVWKKEIGPGFSGPAVADGKLYVMDRWRSKDDKDETPPPVKGIIKGTERVLCLDAANGKPIWIHEYDCDYSKLNYHSGPRCTPTIHDGKVYTLGSMGHLYCLNAKDGKPIWSKDFMKDYGADLPVWGWAGHLLVEGDKVFGIVGGKDSVAVAWNKDTGKEVWKALDTKEIGYAPPIIYQSGGKSQLIIWHTREVNSLDPETGKLYWTETFPTHGKPVPPGIVVATPRLLPDPKGDLLFVSSPHHGSACFRLGKDKPSAELVWKGESDNVAKPDGLHSLNSSPILLDKHYYGCCSMGELRCLNAETGARVWESKKPFNDKQELFGTVFLVPNGERVFLFTDQGELILAKLSEKGYDEISRTKILEPTLTTRGRTVVWSHPAFAEKKMFVRNDKEIVCVSLAK